MVPEIAVEVLPLGITAALVPEFAVERPALGQNTDDDDDILIISGGFISLLKYLWAHPIKSATSRH